MIHVRVHPYVLMHSGSATLPQHCTATRRMAIVLPEGRDAVHATADADSTACALGWFVASRRGGRQRACERRELGHTRRRGGGGTLTACAQQRGRCLWTKPVLLAGALARKRPQTQGSVHEHRPRLTPHTRMVPPPQVEQVASRRSSAHAGTPPPRVHANGAWPSRRTQGPVAAHGAGRPVHAVARRATAAGGRFFCSKAVRNALERWPGRSQHQARLCRWAGRALPSASPRYGAEPLRPASRAQLVGEQRRARLATHASHRPQGKLSAGWLA